jgi:hypothetical protein
MTTPADDRLPNEIMVTGAVYMALQQIPEAQVEPNQNQMNSLLLWLPWMKSRYRVTITMDPE